MSEETISGYVDQLIAFARVAGYEGINLTLRSDYTLLKSQNYKDHKDKAKKRAQAANRRHFVLQRLVKFAEIVKAKNLNAALLSTTDSEPVKEGSSTKENTPLKFSFTMNSRSNLWNEDTINLMNKAIELAEFVIVLDPLELKLDQHSHPSTDRFKMREWRAGDKAFSKPIIDSFFKTIIKKLKADKNKLILYSSIAVLMEQTVKEKRKFWSTTMSDYCKILSSQRKNGKKFTFKKLPTTKSIKDLSPFTVEIKKVSYKVHYNSQKKAELVDEYRGIAINMEQDRACAGMEAFPNLTFFSRIFEKPKVSNTPSVEKPTVV
uniref:Uncharacterized protein n=1 Tax=Ditylenchus dipsaci TaxID=166011 RepID=A0A915DTU5_9BILA